MATVSQVLREGGVVHATQEAVWLIEAATGCSRTDLLIRRADMDEPDAERALELARRRAAGEPLQYLTGIVGFRRLELAVGPGVFIPRPETELVAERAMELLPPHGTLVDVGTGSGAIALSVAVERPDAFVVATESSSDALRYATRNAERCHASVEFILCDLLSGVPSSLRGIVDVCVSNPPYVPLSEGAALPRDVVDHEPHLALFAGGDGLGVLRRVASEARAWLRSGGWLVLEIGDRQGAVAGPLLHDAGYREVAVRRDLAGRERIVEATI
ncbi:MAG: peptide chain release factor N(5)-glutamine methyltransferase [Actinomycetota bacterium]